MLYSVTNVQKIKNKILKYIMKKIWKLLFEKVKYRYCMCDKNTDLCIFCKNELQSAGSEYCGKCINNGNYFKNK